MGKWRGRAFRAAGGTGFADAVVDGATVAAVVIVNAVGDVVAADGTVLAGSSAPPDVPGFPPPDVFARA